ncbi:hypothetical protein SeMB42_g02816 [Synchytrium endobioticum]|nr:hypothetical protein SeMB42_g02816 [Synchytrium endobioticum]
MYKALYQFCIAKVAVRMCLAELLVRRLEPLPLKQELWQADREALGESVACFRQAFRLSMYRYAENFPRYDPRSGISNDASGEASFDKFHWFGLNCQPLPQDTGYSTTSNHFAHFRLFDDQNVTAA